MDALVYVRTEPGSAGRVLVELAAKPSIRRAVLVAGTWDLLAVVEAPDMATIATSILVDVQPIEGIRRTRTAPMVPPDRLGALGGGIGMASHPSLLPGDACYVHVRAEAGSVPSLYERLSELESVTGVAAIAGEFDLLVEIRRPWEIASGVILDQIHPMPGVIATETMVGVGDVDLEEDRDQFSAWS